jgi:hypothetical protein
MENVQTCEAETTTGQVTLSHCMYDNRPYKYV